MHSRPLFNVCVWEIEVELFDSLLLQVLLPLSLSLSRFRKIEIERKEKVDGMQERALTSSFEKYLLGQVMSQANEHLLA